MQNLMNIILAWWPVQVVEVQSDGDVDRYLALRLPRTKAAKLQHEENMEVERMINQSLFDISDDTRDMW